MIVATLAKMAAPHTGMTSFTDADIVSVLPTRNQDSVSVGGVEVGVAHVDADTDQVTARLLRQAVVAVRGRS